MHLGPFVALVSAVFVVGCGAGSAGRAASAQDAPRGAARAEPAAPERAGATADISTPRSRARAVANELAVPEVEERFAVIRQVDALEHAIELYRMFIERAGDDRRYAEAVVRSRARIDDAKATICFLLEKPCDDEPGR